MPIITYNRWSNDDGWNPQIYREEHHEKQLEHLASKAHSVSSLAATVSHGHHCLKKYINSGVNMIVIEFQAIKPCNNLILQMHEKITAVLGQTVLDIHTSRIINKCRGMCFEVWIVPNPNLAFPNNSITFITDILTSIVRHVTLNVVLIDLETEQHGSRALKKNNQKYRTTLKRDDEEFQFKIEIQNWVSQHRRRTRSFAHKSTFQNQKWTKTDEVINVPPRNRTFEQQLKNILFKMSSETKHDIIPQAAKLIHSEVCKGSNDEKQLRYSAVFTMFVENVAHTLVNTQAYSFITNIGSVLACYNRLYSKCKKGTMFVQYVRERLIHCWNQCIDISAEELARVLTLASLEDTNVDSDSSMPWIVSTCKYLLIKDKTDDSRLKTLAAICSVAPIMLMDMWLQGYMQTKMITKVIALVDQDSVSDIHGRIFHNTCNFAVNEIKLYASYDIKWLLPYLERVNNNQKDWKSLTKCQFLDILESDVFTESSKLLKYTRKTTDKSWTRVGVKQQSSGVKLQKRRHYSKSPPMLSRSVNSSYSLSPDNPWIEARSSRRRRRRNKQRSRSGHSDVGKTYKSNRSPRMTIGQMQNRIARFCQQPDKITHNNVYPHNTLPCTFVQAMFSVLANSQYAMPIKTLSGLKQLATSLSKSRDICQQDVYQALNNYEKHVDEICEEFDQFEGYLMELLVAFIPNMKLPANYVVALSSIENLTGEPMC